VGGRLDAGEVRLVLIMLQLVYGLDWDEPAAKINYISYHFPMIPEMGINAG
jgi:hypothetical protein